MKLIPTGLSRAIARQGLIASKNAPQLLFGAGVVSMVGSTVLACRATLKVGDTIDETQEMLDKCRTSVGKKLAAPEGQTPTEIYTEKDSKQDIAKVYFKGGFKVAKHYAPAIALGVVGIACLTKSHSILTQRNNALAAAYLAVDTAFREYRERVVDKYGEQQDLEFRFANEEVTVIDEKTGKSLTEQRVSPDAPSMYARFFDEFSELWDRNPEYNLIWIRNKQNFWNDVLRTRGHVFLNEVYESLGLDHTEPGSVVGWLYGQGGDDFITFGVWDENGASDSARNFVNGREASVLLDFNVDGVIYNRLKPHKEMKAWQA